MRSPSEMDALSKLFFFLFDTIPECLLHLSRFTNSGVRRGGAPMRAPPPLEKSETELIYEDHLSRASYLQPSNNTPKVGYATG